MDITPSLLIISGYVLGSIPFGLLLTRCAGLGDIRSIGSGNIGATNVLRTGKKSVAAATLLLDGLKGACAVWIAMIVAPEWADEAGLAALLGHIFPIWLKFKGGKGVATLLGVVTALSWPVSVMAMLVWLGTAFVTRISSVAALVAIVSMPVFIRIFDASDYMLAVAVMGLVVIAKHHANIARLLKGTEPPISMGSSCGCCGCNKDV